MADKKGGEKNKQTGAKTVIEPERSIPVLDECDVLVVGGGPAGIAAAIGAARLGKKTIVVERYGCLGGVLTTASMEPPAWWRDEAAALPGGIFEELDDRMVKAGLYQPAFFTHTNGHAYDTEALKYVADDMISENGALSLLHCMGVFPLMDGNMITGVVTESKSGRQAILAKRVIDCTGDGDIAYRAGVPCLMADEATGNLPAGKLFGGTLVYGLRGVDTKRFLAHVEEDPTSRHPLLHKMCYTGFKKAEADGVKRPDGIRGAFVFNMVFENEIPAVNHAWVDVDGTDVRSLSHAEIKSRRAIVDGIEIMRKYYLGMENASLSRFSMAIGIRETRRIKGDYSLTMRDIFESRKFEDSIGIYPFCMDGPEGTIPASSPRHFQTPFGITVPQGVENLLVAGRCVSSERRCIGVSRMVNFAMLTGQAAGIASAISADSGVNVREVDISALQKELLKQGVRIR